MALIDANWRLVVDFFGANIIRTVEAGPEHVAPEAIYADTLAAPEPS